MERSTLYSKEVEIEGSFVSSQRKWTEKNICVKTIAMLIVELGSSIGVVKGLSGGSNGWRNMG